MLKLALFLTVLVACAVQINGDLDDDVEVEWERFQAHYPMNFKNNADAERRKANFAKSHAAIKEHEKNNKSSTFKMALNKFSVMDTKEKKKFLGAKKSAPNAASRFITANKFGLRQTPDSIDYRTHNCMQPVKNQGGCGSCWAFSTTTVVEFGKCVTTGTKIALSEQQLVDCSEDNGGCNGGNEVIALKYLASAGFQATAQSYPYTAAGGTCQMSTAVKGAVVSETSPVTYVNEGDADTMKSILAEQRLLSVGIAIVDSFFSYDSGVYTADNCGVEEDILGYHAMAVVGYGTLNGLDYWVIRNSWGSGWGASGYVLFQRGTNLCRVEDWAVGTTITE